MTSYCGLPSNIGQSYQFLLDLLQDLGLDISIKKLCPPSTKVICLGHMSNVSCLILLIELYQSQMISYKTYVKCVRHGRIREWSPKMNYNHY